MERALPRPQGVDHLPRHLPAKTRANSPATTINAQGKRIEVALDDEEDNVPNKPSKRSTPRVSSFSSLIFTPDNGSVATRKLVAPNGTRERSMFELYFKDTRRLGKGSYGQVYAATYTLNNQPYAVKIFDDTKGECNNEMTQASVLLAEPHPNCLVYYCAWLDRPFHQFAVVTALCERGSLKALLRAAPLSEDAVWNFFLDALQGLHHMHARRVRHFDIKPENLLISAAGHLCIGDFGVATPVGSDAEYSRGTRPYQAPEAVAATQMASLTTAVDIYSLGVVLYEMVTDYNLQVDAREWQEPPADRAFPVLTSLARELRDIKPYKRPTAAALLERPEISRRAVRRLADVRAHWTAPQPFPMPEGMADVRTASVPTSVTPIAHAGAAAAAASSAAAQQGRGQAAPAPPQSPNHTAVARNLFG